MTVINYIKSTFFNWHKLVPASTLALYRILFGGLMFFSTSRFLFNGWVHDFYIQPQFHFSYLGFDWIPYPTPLTLYVIFAGMLISCLGIMLGLFYRLSAITFFILFTYVELLDKTTYLNHYYFVSLVAFILIFLPANHYFSLDTKFGFAKESDKIPNWSIAILKFQMGVVYVFAGIAKLEADWLIDAQPLKYWLHTAHHWTFFGELLKQDWVAYFFSWFGCVYDLLIVFFLLNSRTRNIAYLFVIVFHFTTWMFFPIGVFPWVMMVGTTIFLSVSFHEKVISFLSFGKNKTFVSAHSNSNLTRKKAVNLLFAVYIFIQIIVPFRYLLYPGNLFWTEQGFRFSWRVMLMEKTGYAEFYILDPVNKNEWKINNRDHLTSTQEKMMSTQPDMILQYAHHLKNTYSDTTIRFGSEELNFKNPEVHAEIYVTLNGRPSQLYVHKKHNLAAIENNLSNRYWLEDFKE
jgi:hypothetical protein